MCWHFLRSMRERHTTTFLSVIGMLLADLKLVFKLGYFSHEKEICLIANVFKSTNQRL